MDPTKLAAATCRCCWSLCHHLFIMHRSRLPNESLSEIISIIVTIALHGAGAQKVVVRL